MEDLHKYTTKSLPDAGEMIVSKYGYRDHFTFCSNLAFDNLKRHTRGNRPAT